MPNGPNNDAAGASEDLANDDEKANNEKEELEEEEEEEEKKKRAYRRNVHLVKVELQRGYHLHDVATLLMAFFVLILSFCPYECA